MGESSCKIGGLGGGRGGIENDFIIKLRLMAVVLNLFGKLPFLMYLKT